MRLFKQLLFFLFFSFILFPLLNGRCSESVCQGTFGGKEGNCAVDFQLSTLDGEKLRLSDYRGKVVFLNFWATWCEPCAVELPALNRLAKELEKRSIIVLTVSIDTEGKDAIERFFTRVINKHRPNFPVLMDADQKISKLYGTFKVPETYILDKTGKIRDKVEGIRDWDDGMIIHYLELLASK